MDINEIFQNNKKWVAGNLAPDPQYFDKLMKGQEPEFLYIGCNDRRETAEELMGLRPGEVFIHRNIANGVIRTDSILNAVVQYAVGYLKV